MATLATLGFALTSIPTVVFADSVGGESEAFAPAPVKPFTDADWFFYISAGVGRPSYDGATTAEIDHAKTLGLESPQAGFFDLPGIYRKLGPSMAAGLVLAMSFENYAKKWRDPEAFAIQSYNPSASFLWFPGGELGRGWFGRADLGASRVFQRRLTSEVTPSVLSTSNRDGIFGQLAFGFGWEASHLARLLLHVNALTSSAGPNTMTALTLNIGFLL